MMYKFTNPIPMPRGSHYGSDYWITYSSKVKRNVTLFSLLEYYNFLILEMSSDVEYFCEQPLRIDWDEGDKKNTSVFDFWVFYNDKSSELQEVKYSAELEGDDNSSLRSQAQIKKQINWCDSNSYNYKLVTDKDIFKGDYFINNLKTMQHRVTRYNCLDMDLYTEMVIRTLNKKSILSIQELINSNVLPLNKEIDFLSLLYQKGIIDLNIYDRPLDLKTEANLCD